MASTSARGIAVGLTVLVCGQAIINIAAVMGLAPLTGIPLPFLSYGGSAVFADMIAIGMLQSVRRHHSVFD